MSDVTNSVPYWTRELAHLRGRSLKLHRRPGVSPDPDITEAALAACDSLLRELDAARVECERLRAKDRADAIDWERVFDVIPCAWLVTDRAGWILDANGAASVLLNLSIRHLRRRQLLVFTENRKVFKDLLLRLSSTAGPEEAILKVRPRDRRPVEMDVIVMPGRSDQPAVWLWLFTPRGQVQAVESRGDIRAIPSIEAPR